jgi:hypothetical protein
MFETRTAHLIGGIWAGLAAGAVFGILVWLAGILPNIAQLVGSSSVGVGFVVQWVISVIVAVAFVVALGSRITSMSSAIVWGLIYGAIWWVLGPLVIMPIWLSADMLPITNVQAIVQSWPKLLMHLVYGGIVGAVYFLAAKREEDMPPARSVDEQQRVSDVGNETARE